MFYVQNKKYWITIMQNITEQKKMQNLIEKANTRFQLVINATNDGIWDLDMQNNQLFLSARWKEQLGYSDDELKNEISSFENLIFGDDKKRVLDTARKYLQNKIPSYDIEFRMIHKNGSLRWIHSRGAALRNAQGIYRISGSHSDITERKLAQQKLIESKRLLDKLSAQIPGVIYQYRLHSNGKSYFPFASENIYQIYEVYPEEVLFDASKVFTRIHPEDFENVVESIQKSFNNLQIWEQEYRVVLPLQGIRWLHGYARPEKLEDQSVLWHGYIRDITDKQQANEILSASQARWNFALEGSGDGVWDWNLINNKVFYSKQWKKMMGYEDNEIENNLEEWKNRIHPDDANEVFEEIKKHLNNEVEFYKSVHRILSKNGEYKWILDRGKVIEYSPLGKPLRMIGTHTDLTERIELEQELLKLNADKDRFMRILSHDLRSPFNAILGFADLLLSNIEKYSVAKIKNHLSIIYKAALSTYNLLEDLLLWSKSQAGKLVFEPREFLIHQLIEDQIQQQSMPAKNKNITLIYHKNAPLSIFVDENMVKTILRNLISNAIKFTQPTGKVEIFYQKELSFVRISIKDNGIGIEEDDVLKLWDLSNMFTTPGTDEETGSGLGLILCKEFVEKHGGEIWVKSQVNVGSTFEFTLPLIQKLEK